MVASTVIVFIVTLIIILIANVLITYLFIRHQKKKFVEQLQAIGEAIPEGKRFVKPQVKQTQGRQNQIEQFANNVKIPANASLPYYNIVRPNNQTQTRNINLWEQDQNMSLIVQCAMQTLRLDESKVY